MQRSSGRAAPGRHEAAGQAASPPPARTASPSPGTGRMPSSTQSQSFTVGTRARTRSHDSAKRAVEHHRLDIAVVPQVDELVVDVAVVGVHRHERSLEAREHRLQVLRAVEEVLRDLALVAEPGRHQRGGHAVGPAVDLASTSAVARPAPATAHPAARRPPSPTARRTSSPFHPSPCGHAPSPRGSDVGIAADDTRAVESRRLDPSGDDVKIAISYTPDRYWAKGRPMQMVELMIDVTDAAVWGNRWRWRSPCISPIPAAMETEPGRVHRQAGRRLLARVLHRRPPRSSRGSQAAWHADRGWIFVSVDHLGVGDSTIPGDTERLDYTVVAAGNQAAEQEVLARLAQGTLVDEFPPVTEPLVLGIGQSMGGCMTVIQQGRSHGYDGIGVLGYSAVHTTTLMAPGVRGAFPWIPRDVRPSDGVFVASPAMMSSMMTMLAPSTPEHSRPATQMTHHRHSLGAFTTTTSIPRSSRPTSTTSRPVTATCRHGDLERSRHRWPVGAWVPARSRRRQRRSAVPVLVAMGERDVIADPRGELRAYQSAIRRSTSTCARGWATCTTSPALGSSSGVASSCGRNGCARSRSRPPRDGRGAVRRVGLVRVRASLRACMKTSSH